MTYKVVVKVKWKDNVEAFGQLKSTVKHVRSYNLGNHVVLCGSICA